MGNTATDWRSDDESAIALSRDAAIPFAAALAADQVVAQPSWKKEFKYCSSGNQECTKMPRQS